MLPAYNAARTLQNIYEEVMAQAVADLIILVSDASHDNEWPAQPGISNPYAVFLNYPQGGQLTMTGNKRGTVDNINETGDTTIPDVAFTFTGGQWHFNMATTNLTAGNTYTFRINLAFGSIMFTVGVK